MDTMENEITEETIFQSTESENKATPLKSDENENKTE